MGRPDPVGIYWGDADWFHNHGFCWFPNDKFKRRNWQFGKPKDHQSLQLTNKLCEKVSIPPGTKCSAAGQATAVYEALILKRNAIVQKDIIVKIFMRIPDIPGKPDNDYVVTKDDLMGNDLPVEEDLYGESNKSESYRNEYRILKYLTRAKCKSTPKYVTNFEQNDANPWTRDGFLCFVVMTKVPGVAVSNIWKTEPTEAQRNEQRQIEEAFKNALIEVMRLGVDFEDSAIRNVIWDKANSKCYLIDFESSERLDTFNPNVTWEDLVSTKVHPDYTLITWGFESTQTRQRMANYSKARSQRLAQSRSQSHSPSPSKSQSRSDV